MGEELNISIHKITEISGKRNISQDAFQRVFISSKDEKFFKQAIIGHIEEKEYNKKSGVSLLSRMTPLFDEIDLIHNDTSNELYFIGKRDGESYICKTGSLKRNDENGYMEYKLDGDYKIREHLGDDIYSIKTSKGAFLFNLKTMERLSDTFDNVTMIYERIGDIPPESLVYVKNINILGYEFVFIGEIDKNGKFGEDVYDSGSSFQCKTPIIDNDLPYDTLDNLMLYKIVLDKLIENRKENENKKTY